MSAHLDATRPARELALAEFASFLAPDWNANDYSNAALSKAEGGADITAALSKLNFGIDDLNRRLRSEVRTIWT